MNTTNKNKKSNITKFNPPKSSRFPASSLGNIVPVDLRPRPKHVVLLADYMDEATSEFASYVLSSIFTVKGLEEATLVKARNSAKDIMAELPDYCELHAIVYVVAIGDSADLACELVGLIQKEFGMVMSVLFIAPHVNIRHKFKVNDVRLFSATMPITSPVAQSRLTKLVDSLLHKLPKSNYKANGSSEKMITTSFQYELTDIEMVSELLDLCINAGSYYNTLERMIDFNDRALIAGSIQNG